MEITVDSKQCLKKLKTYSSQKFLVVTQTLKNYLIDSHEGWCEVNRFRDFVGGQLSLRGMLLWSRLGRHLASRWGKFLSGYLLLRKVGEGIAWRASGVTEIPIRRSTCFLERCVRCVQHCLLDIAALFPPCFSGLGLRPNGGASAFATFSTSSHFGRHFEGKKGMLFSENTFFGRRRTNCFIQIRWVIRLKTDSSEL